MRTADLVLVVAIWGALAGVSGPSVYRRAREKTAQVPADVRYPPGMNGWQNLGRAYLRGRPNLARVYLLIDARHGLKSTDAEALDALDKAAVSYQIVLTKADKLKPAQVTAITEATLKAISRRPAAFPRVVATSSETKLGLAELKAEIALAALPAV